MRGFNRVIIMGNLARDPEIRYTASQKAVASFSVAVNRQWSDQNGERREEVTFIPVVVWGKPAETCEKYLRKGSGILVEGRINTRSYESKTGEKRYVTEVIADSFQFVGGRPDGSASQGEGAPRNRAPQNAYQGGRAQSAPAPRSFRDSQASQQGGGYGSGSFSADSFPMDISELDSSPASLPPVSDETDIPF